jgi:hypothetical protein
MICNVNPKKGSAGRRAKNFNDYVFGATCGNGKTRIAEPQKIIGCEQLLVNCAGRILGVTVNNEATTFNLCFEEWIDLGLFRMIAEDFHEMVTIGIDPLDLVYIGGAHEKSAAGKCSSDGHILYLNSLLRSGVRWNAYFEKSDRALFTAWAELTNYRHNLSSPKDPAKTRLAVCLPNSKDEYEVCAAKEELNKALCKFIRDGNHGKDSILQFLREYSGVRNMHQNPHSVSVKIEIKGDEHDFLIRGAALRSGFVLDKTLYPRRSQAQYEADFKRGLNLREARHCKLYNVRPRNRSLGWLLLSSNAGSDRLKQVREFTKASLQRDREPTSSEKPTLEQKSAIEAEVRTATQPSPVAPNMDSKDHPKSVEEGPFTHQSLPPVACNEAILSKFPIPLKVHTEFPTSIYGFSDLVIEMKPNGEAKPGEKTLPLNLGASTSNPPIPSANSKIADVQTLSVRDDIPFKKILAALIAELKVPERTVAELLEDRRFLGSLKISDQRLQLTDEVVAATGKNAVLMHILTELRTRLREFSDEKKIRMPAVDTTTPKQTSRLTPVFGTTDGLSRIPESSGSISTPPKSIQEARYKQSCERLLAELFIPGRTIKQLKEDSRFADLISTEDDCLQLNPKVAMALSNDAEVSVILADLRIALSAFLQLQSAPERDLDVREI